ncbi:MAG TPA: HAD-IC family P-type ATPase, partial [Gammaproteobacteria bacterium]|nr:HAD-IC family P-type ATPase [Gammaproteobacteria bacterium]
MQQSVQPPDSRSGLSSRTAAARLLSLGPNELPQGKPRNLLHLVRDVMRDPMFLLLVACGVLYLILGEFRDALMLLAFVLLVIAITIYQEYKTEHALSALKELTSPRALVIRDGIRMLIPSRELVPGDLVVVSEGDRIPADGVLIEGMGVSVDESLLTGESAPVMHAPAAQSAQVSSGTLVVQGRGLMRVERTGRESAIGAIGHSLVTLEHPVTRLETETRRVVRILAIIGGGISVLVAAGYALKGAGWLQGALAGLTLAMSILPEEFPVVLVVFLALGAWRLAKHNVLTRRMNAIETLGAASVLCVDKTGTLTMNRMRLAALHDGDSLFEYSGNAVAATARFSSILRHGALASTPESFDPMEQALFSEAGDQTEHVLLREYPLSHNLMAITRILRTDDGDIIGACKGAPEAIIELCNPPPARRKALEDAVTLLAARGWRVLGVASVREPRAERLPDNLRHFAFAFLGFMAFEDPLRAGVPDAVRECHRAGIRVMLITGDHARTAASIARQAGIPEPDNTLSGADIERMDDTTLLARLHNTLVFCRMVPQQKLRLVQALQSLGHVVAMTG